jgi:hypothetical protein
MGCYSPPPLIEISSRDLEGGGARNTMKSDSMSNKENGTSRPLKRGRSSRFPMQLLFLMIGPFHPMGCDSFSQR